MTYRAVEDISDRLDRLAPVRPVATRPIDAFQLAFNETTKGVTISFTLVSASGISSIVLKRNFSQDPGTAVAVNTWDGSALGDGQQVSFEDTDQSIKGNPDVFYWLDCKSPAGFAPVTVGPQNITLIIDPGAPLPILDFDASHAAVSGGTVLVGVAFRAPSADPRFQSCKILITGYNGVAATVEIAQSQVSPFSFSLEQTGETVTLKAISVSQLGIEASSGPTKSLTLGSTATVPAKIIGSSATEIVGGVQISFPAGPESAITQYQIYRGRRGGGFAAASSIGTVSPTGESAYTFLDSGGLTGLFEWYVFAVNGIGNGPASDAIVQVQAGLTSADQPPNSPSNQVNFATVDSVDAGSDATIRIYGAGGVGSAWTFQGGYGNLTIAAGTILHVSYNTDYYVVWDTQGQQYLFFTTAPQTLPDFYIWGGKVHTVSAGGTGGSSGGGGSTGGPGGFGSNRGA